MADEPTDTPNDTPDEPTGRVLTDDEVRAIATREARTAERRERQRIADQLGCTPEEAAERLAAAAAAEDAQRTEAERLQADAQRRIADADERIAAAAAREREMTRRDLLRDAGVPADRLARAVRSLDLTDDATDDEVAAEIAAAAEVFAPATDHPPAPPAGVTPPHQPGGKGGGRTADDRAKERWARTQRPLSDTA